MFQSRCGICCEQCDRMGGTVSCSGCLTMKIPFWGSKCKVKSCCESKALDHCGQCDSFPCEMLSRMGKEEGYDSSAKIKQCRIWASEEKIAREEQKVQDEAGVTNEED